MSSPKPTPAAEVALREVVAPDLPTLFAHQADPDACRMAMVHPRDRATFEAHWIAALEDPNVTARAILADGALVGYVTRFPANGQDAVGYWIAKEYWGRGIASRALAQLLSLVTTRPLHASVARENAASIRVLERCGFVITKYERSPETDRYRACEVATLVLE